MEKKNCADYARNEQLLLRDLKQKQPIIEYAWICLNRSYRYIITSYHRGILQDEFLRREAYFDTIYEFWRKIGKNAFEIQGKNSIPKYLVKIFQNCLLSLKYRGLPYGGPLDPQTPGEDYEAKIISSWDYPLHIRQLRFYIKQLSPQQREIAELFFLEGLEKPEILKITKIDGRYFDKVKSKVRRNLKSYYKKMQKKL